MKNAKAWVAEFVGTFALCFLGIGSVALETGIVGVALAHGLAIAVMASAVGAISGGHFNPAVTFAALITGKIGFGNAIGYWISQILGAIAGTAAIAYGLGAAVSTHNYAIPAMSDGTNMTQALVLEAVATFFLVFVIFGTAMDRRAPKVGAIFIGLTITAAIFAIGGATGAALNPARYLGPAVMAGDFTDLLLYLAGPLLGGTVAGILYGFFLGEFEPDMPTSEVAP